MNISVEWLRRYVDVDVSPGELAHRLTMAGYPVIAAERVASAAGEGEDVCLDVEITSNRPDLHSHVGIAREVAGLVGADVRLPAAELPPPSDDRIAVAVTAPDLCPRYTARVIRGVTVGPSPDWLVRALEAVGQRSVNNVVDITNFVLLETGHPLHAFDLAKLAGPSIVARRAAGEAFTAIDGSALELGENDLAIADAVAPVALAGVMGGLQSEVVQDTRDVVLECALFEPLAIRAASRAHQLRSESSFRFERFVDPAYLEAASDRAAALMVELCGARAVGPICSAGPGAPVHGATIDLRMAQIPRILGIDIEDDEARGILASLGCEEESCDDAGVTRWRAPSWRPDLEAEIDLVEEVARRVGFERVPDGVRIPVRPLTVDPAARALRRLRDALVACGLRECCTAPFVGAGRYDIALLRDAPPLVVENPMRTDENLLRRSLLGPLLRVVRGNQDRGVSDVRFFECAPVYLPGDAPDGTEELTLAAGVVTGDYADVKGAVEFVLHAMGLDDEVTYEAGAPAPLRRDRSATLRLGDEVLGHVGELGRRALAEHGLESPTAVFELRGDLLAAKGRLERPYTPVSRFPAVERDLAVVVTEDVPWGRIAGTVRAAAGPLLADLRPFDVYRGEQVGAGNKSVALRMELRAPDRTLTGDEADACVAGVVKALGDDVGGRLRA